MKRPAGDWLVLAGGVLVTLASGAPYVIFGGGALVDSKGKPHFIAFVVIGALVASGALLGGARR